MARKKKDEQGKPKRRARGEGTVIERADGRFVARIPLGGGKRKEEYYDTKQEAERAKRRMLNERDEGRLVAQKEQTLEEYLFYWLKSHRVGIRKSTYSSYYVCLTDRVIPVLGHVGLKKLTVEMFQSLYQKWEQDGMSPNTIRLTHTIVKKALNDAVQWKKLVYNPVQHVKLPKSKRAKVYMLSDEEIARLLQCAQQMRLYPFFRMALLLGMRIGELIGLKWSDIDLDKATLQIERTVSYIPNPDTSHYEFVVGPPKTEMGERVIYLPNDIVEMLRDYRQQQLEIQANASRWVGLDLVFCNRTGGYIIPRNIRPVFEKLLLLAGLEHMKFHALRHNASLVLRRLGIDPVVRKEILGHSSLEMTDNVYGHSTQRMHKDAAKEIDRLFRNNNTEA